MGYNLRFHPGVIVAAPVFFRFFPVDGLGGAAVETAQAAYALRLDPSRLAAGDQNSAAGADFLAQPAANAVVGNDKGLGRAAQE